MSDPAAAHTILFDWDFEQFNRLVSNCDHDETVQIALEYLPREGVVLEAGCGPGHVIEYLQKRGYNIEGVELNAPVVAEVRRRYPHLRISVGDIAALPCADNTYTGLLSFGVVEHFRHGMRPPLAEHLRVLKPGGIAVISVPSFSTLRRLKHGLRAWLRPLRPRNWPGRRQPALPVNRRDENGFIYHVMPRQGDFFEYWLRREEFEREVTAAGFEIVASLPTHHYTGLWAEFGESWVRNDHRHFRPKPWAILFHHLMRHWPFFHNFHAHHCSQKKIRMKPLRTAFIRLLRRTGLYHSLHDWRRSRRFQKASRAAVALWESQGRPVPPPDIVKYDVIRNYARLHGTPVLVETGTWFGNALFTLRNDFHEIHSIELAPELHAQASSELGHLHHIHLHLGDSAALLPPLAQSLSAPTLYWLDGHWCAGPSARGEKDTPISEELSFLLNRPPGRDIVLIDDARCFNGENGYPSVQELRTWVAARRPHSSFTLDNDIIRIVPV